MKLVLVESPYAGEVERNRLYAKLALRDSLLRGEAPFASHLLYTQMLHDTVPDNRRVGIEAGLAWGAMAQLTAVYEDYGVSKGMQLGIESAIALNRPVEARRLPRETLLLIEDAIRPCSDQPGAGCWPCRDRMMCARKKLALPDY